MTNIATDLTTTAERSPEQSAIRIDGSSVSYAQLHAMAAKVAGQLRAAGIEPGDRVAIILPNVPAFPVVFYGILLAGGVVVPMNPLLKSGEIDYFFTNSGAKMAFVWPDFVAEATKGAERSGTTIIECTALGPVEGSLPDGQPVMQATERADDDDALQHRVGFGAHLRDRVAIEHAAHEHKPLRAIRLDIDPRYLGCASIHLTTGCHPSGANDRRRLLTESKRSEPVAAFGRKRDAVEIAPVRVEVLQIEEQAFVMHKMRPGMPGRDMQFDDAIARHAKRDDVLDTRARLVIEIACCRPGGRDADQPFLAAQ